MEKRVLIAVILSFIVLYAYQVMFPPPKPAPGTGAGTPATSPGSSTATSPAPLGSGSAGGIQKPAEAIPPQSAPSASPLVADAAERDITVENPSVNAVFTTRGGALKSWRLKKYQDSAGQALELIPHTVPAGTVRPFTLSVGDPATDATLASALFKPSADQLVVTAGTATLTFEYADASGLTARKQFVFSPELPYVIDFSATAVQSGKDLQPSVQWGPAIGSGVVISSRSYNPASQPVFYRDGTVYRVAPTEVAKNAVQDAAMPFAGV